MLELSILIKWLFVAIFLCRWHIFKINKRNDNKGEVQDHQHSGYPTLFTKVGARFPKMSIMRHYQGVNQDFGKMTFLKILEKIMWASHLLANMWCAFPMQLGSIGLCMGPGGVSPLMGFRNEALKAPAILRHLNPENS